MYGINGNVLISKRQAVGYNQPILAQSQDYTIITSSINNGILYVKFQVPYSYTSGNMIWAFQSTSIPIAKGSDITFSYHDQKGSMIFSPIVNIETRSNVSSSITTSSNPQTILAG